MKKYSIIKTLVLLSFCVFFMTSVKAQVGFRAGVLISKQDFEHLENGGDVESKLGADLAFVFDIPSDNAVTFSPEIHWLQKGTKISNINGSVGESSRTFNYLEIPLMVKFHFGEGDTKFFLMGGPSLGYLLNGTDKDHDGQTNDIDLDFYKRTEYGAHIGGGIAVGPVRFDLRYVLGLSNIFDDDTEVTITNRGYGAGIAFMF